MTTVVIEPSTQDITLYVNEGVPGGVTLTGTQEFSNKTIPYATNTLTGVQPELVSGTNIKTVGGESLLGSGNLAILTTDLANEALTNVKTLTFANEQNIATAAGAITIDWSQAQCQKQSEPTGGITYTFTPPPGPCHLQLRIISDGTSSAQAFVWPASVKWLLFIWTALPNKGAIINFWYDGTNYWAMGSNAV